MNDYQPKDKINRKSNNRNKKTQIIKNKNNKYSMTLQIKPVSNSRKL
jgi:hypothetical protein